MLSKWQIDLYSFILINFHPKGRTSEIKFDTPRKQLDRDLFIFYYMQIFSQYIINQYFLQNTVKIICKEKDFQ